MAELRSFDNNSFLNIEDVFVAKQMDSACPACKLAAEERIIPDPDLSMASQVVAKFWSLVV